MPGSTATTLGKYEIVGQLARGHTTDLLLARSRGMGGFERYVVLKRVREERRADAVFVKAFIDEARVAAALHHHNIVQVQDVDEANGVPYFTMEYIQGEDLRTLLARMFETSDMLPLQHLVTIGTAVAAALHHAHEQKGADGKSLGIIHRDVSPGNIIVGYDGHVKVVDFSMAKATITTVTSVGVVKGKAGYMAPEQCAGEKLDRRSDTFALGIVLYEMATVRRLFKGSNDHDTMRTIVLGSVPRANTVRADLPDALDAIIAKALSRLPADRYQTALDLGNALEKFGVEAGLAASPTALAAFMRKTFGEPKQPSAGVTPKRASTEFDSGEGVASPSGADRSRKTPNPYAIHDRADSEAEATIVTNKPPTDEPTKTMSPASISARLAKAGMVMKLPAARAAAAPLPGLSTVFEPGAVPVMAMPSELPPPPVAEPGPPVRPTPPSKLPAPIAKGTPKPAPVAEPAAATASKLPPPKAPATIAVSVAPPPGVPATPPAAPVTPPASAAVVTPGAARGDPTQLVEPLVEKVARAGTVQRTTSWLHRNRYLAIAAAALVVVGGTIYVIATSGSPDLEPQTAAAPAVAQASDPVVAPTPEPAAAPSPEPSTSPTPSPEPTPTPSPTPSPEPAPTPSPAAEPAATPPPAPSPEPAPSPPVVEPKPAVHHVAHTAKPHAATKKPAVKPATTAAPATHTAKSAKTTKKKPAGTEYDPDSLFLKTP